MLKQRVKGLLSRNKTGTSPSSTNNHSAENFAADSPEANVTRAIRLFCESGSNSNGGEEVLHLPVIVEAAESSPSAAANAASQIRTFLTKDWSKKPHVQYNAIMLIRILCDNPGPTFTRKFDKSFVSTVKELLRNSKDPSTIQIMRETLDALEVNKASDENLQGLMQMWRKEKGSNASLAGNRASHFGGGMPPMGMVGGQGQQRGGRQLPDAVELASRVEEAKNTAKILLQLVSSTPEAELLNSELIKEFNQRCQSAQRSMQGYINCDNPAPDHDTMQTLIETNEQLSLATSRYQRATLSARRTLGVASTSPPVEPIGHSAFAPPPGQQSMPPSVVPRQQQTTSAFGNGDGQQGLQAPLIPQQAQQQQPTSAFGTGGGVYQGYQAPSGPPPSQQPQQQQQANNPFSDPSEQQNASQRPHSQSFNIDSGATFAPQPYINTQTTGALENAYASTGGLNAHPPTWQVSPVSPQSPSRSALGAYHQSDITQSYVGRQQSAANGFSMHGAGEGGQGQGGSMADRGRGY